MIGVLVNVTWKQGGLHRGGDGERGGSHSLARIGGCLVPIVVWTRFTCSPCSDMIMEWSCCVLIAGWPSLMMFWGIAYVQQESARPAPGWQELLFSASDLPFGQEQIRSVQRTLIHDIHIFAIAKILLIRRLLPESRL